MAMTKPSLLGEREIVKLRVAVPRSLTRFAYTCGDGSTLMRRKAWVFVLTVKWFRG